MVYYLRLVRSKPSKQLIAYATNKESRNVVTLSGGSEPAFGFPLIYVNILIGVYNEV